MQFADSLDTMLSNLQQQMIVFELRVVLTQSHLATFRCGSHWRHDKVPVPDPFVPINFCENHRKVG